MKSKTLLTITVSSLLVLVLAATGYTLQVTQNSYEDGFPSLKGNYLVWQGKTGGDWEIFLYDIGAQETVQITNNDYNDISPQTDGNYVVWIGYNTQGGEIFLYDISTESTVQITNNASVDNPPQIAAGKVAWASFAVTDSVEPGDINLYDIQTVSASCLSCAVDPESAFDDNSPKVSADTVTWVQTKASGVIRFLYDIVTNVTSEAPDGFVWQASPQVAGDLRVTTRHDGEDREIFVTSASLRATDQITDNSVEDRSPCISGATVAWVQGDGVGSELFLLSDIGKPEARFVAEPTSGTAPLTVRFTNESNGFVNTWSWNFGDGANSGEQSPSHTYTSPGSFAVSLTVTGPTGTDTETKQDLVHVSEPLCECMLVPDVIQIAQGGTLGFQATVQNNSSKRGTVHFGTKVRKPDGQLTDFLWGPLNVWLTEDANVSVHKTHGISASLPVGTYGYYGYVWHDNLGMLDVCSFEFEVIE